MTDQRPSSLAMAMFNLYSRAGSPGVTPGSAAAGVSRTSYADAVAGRKVLSWEMTERIVTSLGGDPGAFRPLWEAERPIGRGNAVRTSQRSIRPVVTRYLDAMVELIELTSEIAVQNERAPLAAELDEFAESIRRRAKEIAHKHATPRPPKPAPPEASPPSDASDDE